MSHHLIPLLLALGALVAPGASAIRPGLPASTLAVRTGAGWRIFWRADAERVRWSGPDTILTRELRWRSAGPGVEWAEAALAGSGEARRTRLVVARLDPARLTLSLASAATAAGLPAWSVDRADPDLVFAVNAGQFVRAQPWGWLVIDGVERLAPGQGPLSTAVMIDRSGRVRLVAADSIATVRGEARLAFQSYPTLLRSDGSVPAELLGRGGGIDVEHRDARLAIGLDREGRILVAMTRFDGLGSLFDFAPFGLTTPEMAGVMGALGAGAAVALDGGISSQLVLGAGPERRQWTGLRRVPLGLVARPR